MNSTVAIDAMVLGVPALVVGLPNNLSPFVEAGAMAGRPPGAALARRSRGLAAACWPSELAASAALSDGRRSRRGLRSATAPRAVRAEGMESRAARRTPRRLRRRRRARADGIIDDSRARSGAAEELSLTCEL